jgi:hypothetical protein
VSIQTLIVIVETIGRARTACKDDELFHNLLGLTYPRVHLSKIPAQQYCVAKVDLRRPVVKLSMFYPRLSCQMTYRSSREECHIHEPIVALLETQELATCGQECH